MDDELEELVIKIRELPTVTQGKALIAAHTDKAVKEARINEVKRMREAMTFAHMTPSIYAAERIKNILGEVEL